MHIQGYMCTSGDGATNAVGMRYTGAGHLENREAQVELLLQFIAPFLPILQLVGLSENPCTAD